MCEPTGQHSSAQFRANVKLLLVSAEMFLSSPLRKRAIVQHMSQSAKTQKKVSHVRDIIKHTGLLFKIKMAQAAPLFGDLHWAFHAPQPPGPKQKLRTPPVSQFSCTPDWSLREEGPPSEREPVFPVCVEGVGAEPPGGEEILTYASCLRTASAETQTPSVGEVGSGSDFNALQRDIIQKNALTNTKWRTFIYQDTFKGFCEACVIQVGLSIG